MPFARGFVPLINNALRVILHRDLSTRLTIRQCSSYQIIPRIVRDILPNNLTFGCDFTSHKNNVEEVQVILKEKKDAASIWHRIAKFMDNMEGGCVCAQCCHPACPPVNSGPPYDEVSHEIDNNIISIKVGKDAGKIEKQDSPSDSAFDAICSDIQGKRCREGCTKVNVISNQTPPPKRPEEEMLLLRSIRQFMPNDDLKNTLEIEFKAPRNYKPLPQPGPPPPIIIPKCNFKGKKGKQKGEGRSKAKKK